MKASMRVTPVLCNEVMHRSCDCLQGVHKGCETIHLRWQERKHLRPLIQINL